MAWPKGRPRSASDKAKIAASMRLTGGRKRKIELLFQNVARVPLGNGHSAILDPEDVGLVEHRSWHEHSAGYAAAGSNGSTIYMHRLILGARSDQEVDHKNGDRLDNRRSNLRFATDRQQRGNQISRPGSRSRFRGVTWDKNGKRWAARVGRKWLGLHDTEEQAARMVDAELVAQFGDYARLNFS